MKYISFLLLILISGCKASTTTAPSEQLATPSSSGQTAQPSVAKTEDASGWSARDIIGKSCRVSLRRDALGMSAPGFAEPMSPMIGGKRALLAGTVERLTDSWLVLRGDSRIYWIPINAILILEVEAKSAE